MLVMVMVMDFLESSVTMIDKMKRIKKYYRYFNCKGLFFVFGFFYFLSEFVCTCKCTNKC